MLRHIGGLKMMPICLYLKSKWPTFKVPRSLLTTMVARASCSMSSAMIMRGKEPRTAASRMPTMSRAVLIFLSTSSSLQLSNSATCGCR